LIPIVVALSVAESLIAAKNTSASKRPGFASGGGGERRRLVVDDIVVIVVVVIVVGPSQEGPSLAVISHRALVLRERRRHRLRLREGLFCCWR
jgi:hypothetical protein